MDASKAPEKQRPAFVALAVRRAAPFDDPEFQAAWTRPGHASVWYWSRSRVRELLGPQNAKQVEFLPEALFTGIPAEDAPQLLELANGFEGRIWKGGRLTASRWWRAVPTAQEWNTFLRSSGATPTEDAVPSSVPAPVASTSWSRPGRREIRVQGLDAVLPKAGAVFAIVAVLALTFEVGQLIRARIDLARTQSAAEQLDEPLRRILDAREAAERDAERAEALLGLRPIRPQVELMAEVSRLVPGSGWRMRHWLQPVEDRLEVTMAIPGADAEQLVSAWEESPMFSGVTIDVSGRDDEVSIAATITPPDGLPSSLATSAP